MKEKGGDNHFLKEAHKSFKKGRYGECQVLLENLLRRGPRHPYPYFLLAATSLFLNRFNMVHDYIGRGERIDENYEPLVQLKTFLRFKAATSYEDAVLIYVEAMKLHPSNKKLGKALKQLRRAKHFSAFQKKALLHHFVTVPSPPSIEEYQEDPRDRRRGRPYYDEVEPQKKNSRKFLVPSLILFILALSGGGDIFSTSMDRNSFMAQKVTHHRNATGRPWNWLPFQVTGTSS